MKAKALLIRVPASDRKTRAHRILFDRDLPFRPLTVDLKTRYQRRPKHTGRA